jgi:hypothetical protein
MESAFHATVMQRPQEDEDERLRRDRINGTNQNPRSPSDHPPPFSPAKILHPRTFNNKFHPPTPAPLPAYIERPPASPLTSLQATEYNQPAPRDRPTSSYYDPTTDSSERRLTETAAGWFNGHAQTPQVSLHSVHAKNNSSTSINANLKNREAYSYPSTTAQSTKYYNGTYSSPADVPYGGPRSPISHSHPISQSPGMATIASPIARQSNGVGQSVMNTEPLSSPSVSCIQIVKASSY